VYPANLFCLMSSKQTVHTLTAWAPASTALCGVQDAQATYPQALQSHNNGS